MPDDNTYPKNKNIKNKIGKGTKITRRAFIVSCGITSAGLFAKFGWTPISYLGKFTDLGMNFTQSVKETTTNTLNSLLNQDDYKTLVDLISKELEISNQLRQHFTTAYDEATQINQILKKAGNDLESLEIKIYNDAEENLTYQKFKTTAPHKINLTLYDKAVNLVGNLRGKENREINSSEYTKAYQKFQAENEKTLNIFRGIQIELNNVLENPTKSSLETVMKDYITVHTKIKDLQKRNILHDFSTKLNDTIDEENLNPYQQLGPEFEKYSKLFQNKYKYENIFPYCGIIISGVLGLYAGEKLSKPLAYLNKILRN